MPIRILADEQRAQVVGNGNVVGAGNTCEDGLDATIWAALFWREGGRGGGALLPVVPITNSLLTEQLFLSSVFSLLVPQISAFMFLVL